MKSLDMLGELPDLADGHEGERESRFARTHCLLIECIPEQVHVSSRSLLAFMLAAPRSSALDVLGGGAWQAFSLFPVSRIDMCNAYISIFFNRGSSQ
jgi:hypothetical protein